MGRAHFASPDGGCLCDWRGRRGDAIGLYKGVFATNVSHGIATGYRIESH